MLLQGLLLVDKPRTWTSFDVVNYVRRMVATANGTKPKNTKVGHTGTLDPLATGLLVLLIGKDYTRRAGELTKVDKTYEVTMKLGETSSTGDGEGEITKYRHPEFISGPPAKGTAEYQEKGAPKLIRDDDLKVADADADAKAVSEGEKTVVSDTIPTPEAVLEALQSLQGPIMQVPPAFSAMKINGQRAYKLAREGKAVELEARPVTIYSSELTDYNYPYVKFTSRVSSGTYIRSLVVDLGELLGTGAYMSDLRRTSVSNYELTEAQVVTDLNAERIYDGLQTL